MDNSVLLIVIAAIIGLSLLTMNNPVNIAVAASKGNGGAGTGPVVQE